MLAMELQKAAEYSHNIENIISYHVFIVLQQLAFFPTLEINKSFLKSICYVVNPVLTKFVQSRWLDIHFYRPLIHLSSQNCRKYSAKPIIFQPSWHPVWSTRYIYVLVAKAVGITSSFFIYMYVVTTPHLT